MSFGDTRRGYPSHPVAISMSPLALEKKVDVILGWDWIVSHDLKKFHILDAVLVDGPNRAGRVS